MSILRELAVTVTERFEEVLADASIDIRVIQDNEDVQDMPADDSYCRLVVQLGDVEQPEAGTRMHRTIGQMLVQLFAPLDTGDGEQLGLADTICDGFRAPNAQISGPPHITFTPPARIASQPLRVGAFWQCVVAIPFRGDEFNE